MDLTGSLVNTSLRVYPSEKCLKFLETLSNLNEAPQGILKFAKSYNPDAVKKHLSKKPANQLELTNEDMKQLNKIKELMEKDESQRRDKDNDKESDEANESDFEKVPVSSDSDSEIANATSNIINPDKYKEREYLTTQDIEWLYSFLHNKRNRGEKVPYLHELLEASIIETPENEVLKRNPALEARCVKLRAQQEAREYRAMTKGVDNVRIKFPEDSISYQLKQMNRQLIAIGQFLLSIFAGFLFGLRGIEWMIGTLEFGFRLLLGVMCALVIALAEIYFLAKKINEELNVPETVQIGGPPKFVDTKKYGPSISTAVTNKGKEHQD